MAAVMPGTTSNGTPASCRAAASSPPRANTNGSPPLSRTTVAPVRPLSTSRALISAWLGPRPGALPTGIRSAVPGARSSSDATDNRSYTTTSARPSSSAPRTVSSPGSPGPAPTRYTVTGGDGTGGGTVRGHAAGAHRSPHRPGRRHEGLAGGAASRPELEALEQRRAPMVEEVAGDGATERLGVGARRPVAQHGVAVGRRQQPFDLDRTAISHHGVGTGGQVAIATQLGEEASLGVDGLTARGVLDGGQRVAGPLVAGPALDRQRALPHLG